MATENVLEHPASRTLLIPLLIRAQEGDMPGALFRDPWAQRVVRDLPGEFFNFPVHRMMRTGTAVRVRYFDDLTRAFLQREENPVIVQLGCGLDTRFSRTDSGKGVYVNMDLPEVMVLRQRLLPEGNERCLDWAGSILERDWMEKLLSDYPGRRFMFISEGVLMYLQEEGVRALFRDLAENFPGARIAFDTAGSYVSRKINKNSAVSKLSASLTWAYDDDGSLDRWHPRLRRLEQAYYFSTFKRRWGALSLLRYFPPIGKGSAMYHFAVEG